MASLGTGDEAAQECATLCHPSDNTSFKRQNAKQAYCPLREGTGERSAAINKNSDHATFVSEGSVAAGDGGALSANAVAGGSLLTSATRGQTSIVRVQALVWWWLAQRVARWERGWRCGPQLSLELVALVRVHAVWRRRLHRGHVAMVEAAVVLIQIGFRRTLGWWEAEDRLYELSAWLLERYEVVETLEEAGCTLAG